MAENNFQIKIKGLKELETAIRRNPRETERELKVFFVRSIAVYRRFIIRNPWRIGMSSGGVPVDTGALRDSHQSGTKIGRFEASIGPDTRVARYAKYVHRKRPWLDVAFSRGDRDVEKLQKDLLKKIVTNLAK